MAESPIVAAASNLRFALPSIEALFSAETGQSVTVVFGSSGHLYRQINQGAPYEIFLSADESYVRKLESSNLTVEPSFIYGVGRLAYFAPFSSTLDPNRGVSDLRQAAQEHRIKRFVIANPKHAPYGKAALAILQNLAIDQDIQRTLILAENISQAAQLAVSGSTDGGLFAYSLVFSDSISSQGSYSLVPDNLHPPLIQRGLLLKGASETAARFYHYLKTEKARDILSQYGFTTATQN